MRRKTFWSRAREIAEGAGLGARNTSGSKSGRELSESVSSLEIDVRSNGLNVRDPALAVEAVLADAWLRTELKDEREGSRKSTRPFHWSVLPSLGRYGLNFLGMDFRGFGFIGERL